jgi:hypothetical protein
MAQQILRSAQLPVRLGRKCELQLVAFGASGVTTGR